MCNAFCAYRRLTDLSCLQSGAQIDRSNQWVVAVLMYSSIFHETPTANCDGLQTICGTACMQGTLFQDIRLQQTTNKRLVQLAFDRSKELIYLYFNALHSRKRLTFSHFPIHGPNRASLSYCNKSPDADKTNIHKTLQKKSMTVRMLRAWKLYCVFHLAVPTTSLVVLGSETQPSSCAQSFYPRSSAAMIVLNAQLLNRHVQEELSG